MANEGIHGDAGDNTLAGGQGDDSLFGGSGDDTLEGGLGSDRIEGGAGDDTMTGDLSASNSSRDTFVFAPGHGNDTITDFGAGGDVIDLSAFSGIAGLGDLSIIIERDAIVIDLTAHGGGTIRLQNFDIDNLNTNDFVFSDEPDEDGSGAGPPQITHLAYNLEGDDEGDTLEGADTFVETTRSAARAATTSSMAMAATTSSTAARVTIGSKAARVTIGSKAARAQTLSMAARVTIRSGAARVTIRSKAARVTIRSKATRVTIRSMATPAAMRS